MDSIVDLSLLKEYIDQKCFNLEKYASKPDAKQFYMDMANKDIAHICSIYRDLEIQSLNEIVHNVYYNKVKGILIRDPQIKTVRIEIEFDWEFKKMETLNIKSATSHGI